MPRKFHRLRGKRRLFLKSVMASLITKGRIETTVPRAKEVRPMVERFITKGRRGTLADFRMLRAALPEKAAEKLFYEIAPRYRNRRGGYLRIVKEMRHRKRDGVPLARIEFVEATK